MIKHILTLSIGLAVYVSVSPAMAGNWNVPTVARNIENPVAVNKVSSKKGAGLYSAHCTSCHGEDGRGDGPEQKVEYSLQSILTIPTQPGNQPLSDGELYWKITHGVGEMPSFAGTLTDEERWLMVNHIRHALPQDSE